jgi:hypothetical protein
LRGYGGVEIQLHTEGLELHGDDGSGGAARRGGGDGGERETAAGQERGVGSFQRQQVGLGQDLQQVALLQGLDSGADVEIGAEGKKVQQVRG